MVDSQTVHKELDDALNPVRDSQFNILDGQKVSEDPRPSGLHGFEGVKQPTDNLDLSSVIPPHPTIAGPEEVVESKEEVFQLPNELIIFINHLKHGRRGLILHELTDRSLSVVKTKLDQFYHSGDFDDEEHKKAFDILNSLKKQETPIVSSLSEVPEITEIPKKFEVAETIPEPTSVISPEPEPVLETEPESKPEPVLEQKPEPELKSKLEPEPESTVSQEPQPIPESEPLQPEPKSEILENVPVASSEPEETTEMQETTEDIELNNARSEYATLLFVWITKNRERTGKIKALFRGLGTEKKVPPLQKLEELKGAEARYRSLLESRGVSLAVDIDEKLEESFQGNEVDMKNQLLAKAMGPFGGVVENTTATKGNNLPTEPEVLPTENSQPTIPDSESVSSAPEVPVAENNELKEIRQSIDFEGRKIEIVQNTGQIPNAVVLLLDGREFARGEVEEKGPKIKLLNEPDIKSGFFFADTIYEKAFKSKETRNVIKNLKAQTN